MNNWTPTVEVESYHGMSQIHVLTKELMKRRVYIQGEINAESANDFVTQMMYLQSESDDPINVYINSPGGSVTDGLLMYDVIQASTAPVNTICTGLAASMGAILLAGGKKGRRFILPHSKVMIHEPLISRGLGGSATSIKAISDSILETREITNGILAKHTGKTLEEINEATAFDNYMNAKQALEFGIVDKITETMVV